MTFKTTVHGPVVGYATVKGKKVAISSKRSSYGKDMLDLLFNRRLSNGQVKSPKTFFNAASLTPQTFNSFYIDNKNIAEYTSGLLPIRPKGVDPGLLTDGTGKYEWEGFLSKGGHPQGMNPKDGTMTNWNQASPTASAPPTTSGAATARSPASTCSTTTSTRLQKKGKWSLATVTSAMNAGGTQDIRAIDTVPLLKRLLKGSEAPNAQAQQMLT